VNPQPKPTRATRPRKPLRSRSPMKRGAPIARKTWMRRKTPRRVFTEDRARLDFVRSLECWVPSRVAGHSNKRSWLTAPCFGRTEACHEGKKPGVGMKCADSETIPLCQKHHGHWTRHSGVFVGWTKEQRREWADDRIAETTALFLSHGSRRSTR
jgi:hypothetical protein